MEKFQLSIVDDNLNDSVEVKYEECFYCCGFYGPCFGEPVCGVCHDFIFAEDFNTVRIQNGQPNGEKDDGDSGNDEPSEDGDPLPALQNDLNDVILGEEYFMPSRRSWEPSHSSSSKVKIDDRLDKRLALLTEEWKASQENGTDASITLPPEIWSIIFKKLDDISLFMATKVNSRWKTIINDQCSNSQWENYVKKRWPLFTPIYPVSDWYSVYAAFFDSLPCKLCFIDLNKVVPVPTSSRSLRSVRLRKEIKWMRIDHPEGVEAVSLDSTNYNWLARVNGPPQSPYQGGVFYLNLKIPHDYPWKPPGVRFLTKIFHPNISRHGDIGIDCIRENWAMVLTIPQILLSVQSLLTDPYLDISMEKSVASLYQTDRATFDKVARIWTLKYAMHDDAIF